MSLQATQIILRPVISEKSMDQSTVNKYTLAVADDANKMQIKDAVEELFKVTVTSVNVLTTKLELELGSAVRTIREALGTILLAMANAS